MLSGHEKTGHFRVDSLLALGRWDLYLLRVAQTPEERLGNFGSWWHKPLGQGFQVPSHSRGEPHPPFGKASWFRVKTDLHVFEISKASL